MGRLWARFLNTLKITLETPAQSGHVLKASPYSQGIQLTREIYTCNLGAHSEVLCGALASFLFYLRFKKEIEFSIIGDIFHLGTLFLWCWTKVL